MLAWNVLLENNRLWGGNSVLCHPTLSLIIFLSRHVWFFAYLMWPISFSVPCLCVLSLAASTQVHGHYFSVLLVYLTPLPLLVLWLLEKKFVKASFLRVSLPALPYWSNLRIVGRQLLEIYDCCFSIVFAEGATRIWWTSSLQFPCHWWLSPWFPHVPVPPFTEL